MLRTDMAPKRTLLLVDDEENILSALTRLFRRDGYHILHANGGAEGLEVLDSNIVGVIISDQRMPEMTGVEFLSRARELYPDTVRIVLSGYTDLKSVTDAINEGAIYKFLTKPWDDDQLRANVQEAFERYELKQENDRLNDALKRTNEELASLNQVLEQRVEEKTREVLINMRALQVAHDVLESLPVAVIGIANDGLVTVANRLAREWIGPHITAGQMAEDVIPPTLQKALIRSTHPPPHITDLGGHPVITFCGQLGNFCAEGGCILVVIPNGPLAHDIRSP